jgi:hypothetical protein
MTKQQKYPLRAIITLKSRLMVNNPMLDCDRDHGEKTQPSGHLGRMDDPIRYLRDLTLAIYVELSF